MDTKNKEEILLQALAINFSVGWYQKEIKEVIEKIQEIEGSIDYDNDAASLYRDLQGRLSYLLGKGLFENRLIRQFKKKIEKCKD
jgi:hypothetical protein